MECSSSYLLLLPARRIVGGGSPPTPPRGPARSRTRVSSRMQACAGCERELRVCRGTAGALRSRQDRGLRHGPPRCDFPPRAAAATNCRHGCASGGDDDALVRGTCFECSAEGTAFNQGLSSSRARPGAPGDFPSPASRGCALHWHRACRAAPCSGPGLPG